MIMRKLTKSSSDEIKRFLDTFEIEGTFFRSDLEYFNVESEFHRFFGIFSSSKKLTSLILHFFDSMSILSVKRWNKANRELLIEYLLGNNINWISGPYDTFESVFNDFEINDDDLFDSLFVMTANRDTFKPYVANWSVSCCKQAQLEQAYHFINSIPEFSAPPPFERFSHDCDIGIRKVFCVENESSIIGSASIIANNSTTGMIAAVSADPRYRSKGIGRSLVSKLTSDILNEGKVPCLTQNHSESGGLYSELGYYCINRWLIFDKVKFVHKLRS